MQKNWVRYKSIEEKREGYYVVYNPIFTGNDFATLIVNVYDESLFNKVAEIMEAELCAWTLKYPVPVMVMFSDKTGEGNFLNKLIGYDYLMGYQKNGRFHKFWDGYPESEKPDFDLSKESLADIYSGLDSKTLEDVKKEQKHKGRANRALLTILTFWFCLVPMLIAYLGWSSPLFSLLALGHSWHIGIQKGLKMWGKKRKSEKELNEEAEKLQKEHHHYHCKLNPDAFLRLRSENFKKEKLEKEKAKVDSMKD